MKESDRITEVANIGSWTVLIIMALLPFHAVFTTWLGANYGHIDVFRIWKELLVFGVLLPPSLYILWRDSELKTWFKQGWLPSLIVLYMALHLVLGYGALIGGKANESAVLFALIVNLRFLGFFLIVVAFARHSSVLRDHWAVAILWPAVVTLVFGLLQRFALPYDFLKHLGYGPDTIPAYQTVDQKLAYRRIQSTLRGANPFGAYLVMVLPLVLVWLRKWWQRLLIGFAGIICLFFSYSRSAWLGAVITAAILALWFVVNYRTHLAAALLVLIILSSGLVVVFRDSDTVQNTLFHTDENSQSTTSSNDNRLRQIQQGIKDVIDEPIGRGPGTAGPASYRNPQSTRISENYFLQISQEVGVLGLATFAAINLLLVRVLWKHRADMLAKLCLATWVGLTCINLVSHAWTDDTLAYIWWGLAAIATAPVILNEKRKRYDKAVEQIS